MRPRVKICCIASAEEARLAVSLGADALGLVSNMPSGPGVIEEETIARIAAGVPPPVATFLLTSRRDAAGIAKQVRRCGTNTVQIVDAVAVSLFAALRDECPFLKIVQVLHVTGEETVAEAVAIAPHVDALLLDSGNPALAVKELGGTGRTHDWSLSRRIVECAGRPVFLAGGLRPENVARAAHQVQPHGIDVCSGVRTDGRLDPVKLEAFLSALADPSP
jgi:phosphoribosylanthranilate isomerase